MEGVFHVPTRGRKEWLGRGGDTGEGGREEEEAISKEEMRKVMTKLKLGKAGEGG